MAEKPQVVILIPTWERWWCLRYALDSCLHQPYKNVRVVVYDDGSTDETQEMLSSYPDKRVHYVRAPQHRGIARARNALLEYCKGSKYACWLDSDDLNNIKRIPYLVDLLECCPDFAYVRSGTIVYNLFGNDWTWRRPPGIVWSGGPSSATMMWRVGTADKVPFNLNFKYVGEDLEWECRVAYHHGRCVFLPLGLYMIGKEPRKRLSMRVKTDKKKFEADIARKKQAIFDMVQDMEKRGLTKR